MSEALPPTPIADAACFVMSPEHCSVRFRAVPLATAQDLERQLRRTKQFLRDANRGAEVNAQVNGRLVERVNLLHCHLAVMNERLQERTQGMLGTIVGLRNRVRELERRLREVSPAVPTEAMLEREASRARLAQVHPADRFRAMFGEQVKPGLELERRLREVSPTVPALPVPEDEDACAGLCEDCGAGAVDLLPRGGALLCDVCRVGRGWPA